VPNTRTFLKSFSSGEISPEMLGRIDDSKYQQGAATMRNFIAKPQGPAENRPGFSFVKEVKDSTKQTRVIPFRFNVSQTMAIEMGHNYFRFHTLGGTLQYTDGAVWSSSNNYQIADIVKVSGVNYYARTFHSNVQPPNATNWYPLPADYTYEIPSPYLETELFDIKFVQSSDVMTLVHPNHEPAELRRYSAQNWRLIDIDFTATISAPSIASVVAYMPSSASNNSDTNEDHVYVVTAVASDGVRESAASSSHSVSNNIYVTGAKNTITWSKVDGASRYRVYKEQGGLFGFIGERDHDSSSNPSTYNIVDNNIAQDFAITPPRYETIFSGTNNFPNAVSYFEQRRVFAGTNNEPQTIFMTRSGTESDMSYKLPIRDDDRIKFRVAAREANRIKHIVPLTQLLFMTEAAEWRVTSVNSDAITPTSIAVKPQSYVGANDTQPVVVNNSMVYIASRGGHARELGYNWQSNGFITGDLSIRAAHLFDNLDVVDMTLAKAPLPIVWMISTNGKLLGLTYVPEQQVGAWHQHDTDGSFESVAAVAESSVDAVYCVVKRTINGATKRYIERMGTREYATQRDSFFVDSGRSYIGTNTNTAKTVTITSGGAYTKGSIVTLEFPNSFSVFKSNSTPNNTTDINDAIVIVDGTDTYRCDIVSISDDHTATVRLDRDLPSSLQNTAVSTYEIAERTLSGLSHLIGKTVNILADGAAHPTRVVDSNGGIVLNRAASVIHVGLPYISDLQTLPLALQMEAGGQGRVKNINHAYLRVFESSGIFTGPTEDKLIEAKQRTTEPYGSPPNLKTEDIKLMLTPTWQDYGQIFIRQTDPLPLTVVGVTLEVSLGG
tara:strand:- start:1716 stop:4223 length:2508 start_codon:yes stop_codon:yes gene_type:complete